MSVVTKESIQVLFDLQARDTAIDKLKHHLSTIPAEIDGLRKTAEAEKAKAEELKNESKKLQVDRKNKEIELATKEDLIKKHQGDLNNVKSNDAFKALQHEIDNAKKDKGTIEEQVLVLMDQADELVKREKQEAKRVEAHKAEIEVQVKQIEAEAEKVKADLAAKQTEREQAAAQIPPAMLKQYDAIRVRKSGLALVPVRGENCGGCNLKLTPQTIVDVKKHTKLVTCESCQRILFDKQ
jgi:predicted  nucleic acid-binding Zn-ribbon protein